MPDEGTKLPTQQYFLQTPKDLTAVEGSTVDLPCQVGALAGDVQWSKDGFLLGPIECAKTNFAFVVACQ
ncbi:uncharacterized protein TNCT_696701 [Trichonephila clavata]|uniref:Ig-like domain-containing protein n=1 Tax=Trichonephila clavata TaxID=2740835 RepID=A0A8X6K9K5_TRICU|nr:uncharacterized protein TNCT_696701 [Trichonephila clavata]